MIVRRAAAMAGLTAILGAGPAYAGPCTDRIHETNLAVAKLLGSAAAHGRPAAESTFARLHRQPTPGTIASAERQAGDLSADELHAITAAMDKARHADDQDDAAGCETALNEVNRALRR